MTHKLARLTYTARVSRWAELMTELNFETASGKTPLFNLIGKTQAECVAMAAQPETERANTLKTWLAELPAAR